MKRKFSIKQFLINQFRKLFNSYYQLVLEIVIKDLHNLYIEKLFNSYNVSTISDETIETFEYLKETLIEVVNKKKPK